MNIRVANVNIRVADVNIRVADVNIRVANVYAKVCAKAKTTYHFVILSTAKDLFTSTLCFQILRKAQNDSA